MSEDKIGNENDRMTVNLDVSFTLWKNKEVPAWINSNLTGTNREAAYAALAWAGTKWPEIGKILGIEIVGG